MAELPDEGCPKCGAGFSRSDASTFNATGRPIGAIRRFILAAPAWPVLLIAAAVLVKNLWALREPQTATRASWYLGWYFDCLLLFTPRLVQLLARWVVAGEYEHRRFLRKLRSRRPAWPFLLGLIVAASFAAERQLPMAWAFRFSRPALDQLADQALSKPSGIRLMAPVDAGVLHIDSIEIYEGTTVILFTQSSSGYSNWGFVRMPGCDRDELPFEYAGSSKKFAMQRLRRIEGDWFLLFSDYWAHKVGWS